MKRGTGKTREVRPEAARSQVGPVRSSWTALLAATTLGIAGASTVRADIQSDARLEAGRSYRLIVQSYDHADVSSLTTRERPVASLQRAVTPQELKDGISVELLEFRQGRPEADDQDSEAMPRPVVLAWIEEGRADLELDGLRARPQPGSWIGASPRPSSASTVQIAVRGPAGIA
jgi:hypothetical protein